MGHSRLMGEVVRLTRARATKAARDRINELWERGLYKAPDHATKRLQERALDDNDIQNVIRHGRVTHGGPSDFPETPHRYKMEGTAVDGEEIVCVVDINGTLVLVTAYPKD